MGTLKEVLAHLPLGLAMDVQVRVENAALGNHLTKEELEEIVDEIFNRAAVSGALDENQIVNRLKFLTPTLRDAVVARYL